MATDYDFISRQYQESKQTPWRWHVETFTLLELIGNVTGKAVLDLACGEGWFSRLLKKAGAGRVVGVDISAGMIDLARRQEAQQPLGIEYVVQDARNVAFGERFDLVVAAYLLNNASSKAELLEMCQAISRCLKPGCRFVTVNSNAEMPLAFNEAHKKYGTVRITPPEMHEGTPYQWRFLLADSSFEVTNYYMKAATHDWALQAAGFKDIRWHPPRVAPAGEAELGKEFWRDAVEHPAVLFIECVKNAG